jgi:glycosyltransferase involved in cell wall biosynthesis
MDRNPTVSVALCTYNGAPFIAAQLESILQQTRPPDEVIVSDDGSTDETLSIVGKIAARYPSRVRVVQNPRRLGVIKNFESAIAQVTGEIIFLSDQDDVWLENRIARMLIPFAARSETTLVYCNARLVDQDLQPLGPTVFEARDEMRLATRHAARDVIRGVDLGVLGSMMAMRATLRPFVLPIEEVWGAHDHWIIFIAHALDGVTAVDETLMYYRRHERNVRERYSRTLDGEWRREWKLGVRTRDIEEYTVEARRWEAMTSHLKAIAAGDGGVLTAESPRSGLSEGVRANLAAFIRESERRLEFARARERVKADRRSRRLLPMLRLLVRGDYHFYVHGLRSFGKDLLMP